MKNRSLRQSLVFENIKHHQAHENSWSDAKKILADDISKILTESTKYEISTNIEKAYTVHGNAETSGKWSKMCHHI